MRIIRISFIDFWPGFDGKFLVWIMEQAGYNTILVHPNENADIMFYSVFGMNNMYYSGKKVFFCGENIRPPANVLSLSFDFSADPMHYRLPLYVMYNWEWATSRGKHNSILDINMNTILEEKLLSKEDLIKSKNKFCAFIVSNGGCAHRNNFFIELSKKKHVDSIGQVFNNTGYYLDNSYHGNKKLEYIKDFKFVIAFENSSYYGYTTEKIFEPMLVKTVPIYWGSNSAKIEFNTKSYIDVNNLSIDEAVQKVIEIDSNDDIYYEMYREPYLIDNKLSEWLDFNNLSHFIKTKILN